MSLPENMLLANINDVKLYGGNFFTLVEANADPAVVTFPKSKCGNSFNNEQPLKMLSIDVNLPVLNAGIFSIRVLLPKNELISVT
jgi:hypothetical protein